MENKNTNILSQAGKGDKPRNCFSQKYRDNYDSINWNKKNENNTNHNDIAPPPKRGLRTSQ